MAGLRQRGLGLDALSPFDGAAEHSIFYGTNRLPQPLPFCIREQTTSSHMLTSSHMFLRKPLRLLSKPDNTCV